VLVFNKIDAVAAEQLPSVKQDMFELDGQPTPRLFLSAQQGDGLAQLRQMLVDKVMAAKTSAPLHFPDAHEAGA